MPFIRITQLSSTYYIGYAFYADYTAQLWSYTRSIVDVMTAELGSSTGRIRRYEATCWYEGTNLWVSNMSIFYVAELKLFPSFPFLNLVHCLSRIL
jgi:hypothetical protein